MWYWRVSALLEGEMGTSLGKGRKALCGVEKMVRVTVMYNTKKKVLKNGKWVVCGCVKMLRIGMQMQMQCSSQVGG